MAVALASINPAQADFNAAVAAYAQGNFTAAFQDFLELAKQGNVMAQDIVAFMYHRGNGVKKDDVQAYMWLDLAARGGDPDAARFRDELVAPNMKPPEIAKAKELSKSSSLHRENTAGLPSPAEPLPADAGTGSAKEEAVTASAGTVKKKAGSANAAPPVETASGPPMQITSNSSTEKPVETPKVVEQPPPPQAAQPQSTQLEPSRIESAPIEQPPPSDPRALRPGDRQSPPASEARQSSPPSEATQPPPPSKVTPERIALAKLPDARAAPSRAPIESGVAQQSPDRGWTVQLAAVQSEPQAQREWERLRRTHPDLLSELTPTIERFEIGDKHKTFYRVRVGNWKDVKAPAALCNKLKEKGERCFVARRSS